LQKLENLSQELGGPEIYIKRDDMTGLAFGGNKSRKLESRILKSIVFFTPQAQVGLKAAWLWVPKL